MNGTILSISSINLAVTIYRLISQYKESGSFSLMLNIAILVSIIFIFKSVIDIHEQGEKCKELVEKYLLRAPDCVDKVDFNCQALIFAKILLNKPLSITIFKIESFSYSTLTLFVFTLISKSQFILNVINIGKKVNTTEIL